MKVPAFLHQFGRLNVKFNLLTITLIVGITSILTVFMLHEHREHAYGNLQRHGTELAGVIASVSEYELLAQNTIALREIAKGLSASEKVGYFVVLDKDHQVLTSSTFGHVVSVPGMHYASNGSPQITNAAGGHDGIDVVVPVMSSRDFSGAGSLTKTSSTAATKKTIGYIQLGMNYASTDKSIREFSQSIVLLAIFMVLLGIMTTILVTRRTTAPVATLARAAMDIAYGDGNLDVTVNISSDDEVGDLAKAYNQLVERLRGSLIISERIQKTIERQQMSDS